VKFFESSGFFHFKVSLKASDVSASVQANRLFSSAFDYPLHVGVTGTGTIFSGTVKSSAGIGILLHEGIGDTVRVSLTGPPEEEVRVAYEILNSLGLRRRGPEIISCPTCGRIGVDIEKIIEDVEKCITHIDQYVKVAVMGCVVNGPGEAAEADVGVACGKGAGLIFVRGEVIKRVSEGEIVPELVRWVEKISREKIERGM
jgi:(E)-4-hydroxy-3-methylbut-2-enyl-diphosphate synthase